MTTHPLGLDPAMLAARGATWTAREIAQQPEVWAEVARGVAVAGLAGFVADALRDPRRRVVLTGAGTSAFIGECLAPALARRWGRAVEAVATTDLVAAPHHALRRDEPLLLVSFARSGNSPESLAALDLADALVADCRHLVLTCNAEGALARRAAANGGARPAAGHRAPAPAPARVHVLPARTDDRGFAMTSSFTSLLGAAAQAFDVLDAPRVAAAEDVIARAGALCAELASAGHARVVFLGSHVLKGLAHEAALKLLELTDGRVVAVHESPLGFRHGPKTIVDQRTLVVLFLSPDDHARQYDADLLRELRADARAGRVLAVGTRHADADVADFVVAHLDDERDDEVAAVGPLAVFAQMLALHCSLARGLTPDTPNASGTVHRVVRGVTIHPLDADEGGRDVPGR